MIHELQTEKECRKLEVDKDNEKTGLSHPILAHSIQLTQVHQLEEADQMF